MTGLTIESHGGEESRAFIPAIARLRLEVFRDWPYLYDGDPEDEERHLGRYAACPDSVVALAFDGRAVVGASTALPLVHESDAVSGPFRALGIDPSPILYLGESVLLPGYRGQGIGVAFFERREAWARRLGLTRCAFCGVVRDPGDARQPPGWAPLDDFWRKRGYAPVPGLSAQFSWTEIGADHKTAKPMRFWIKDL
ncbi:MAG: GNAT family N-acetyltransferase [Alphaproteobacteria bacterium]|nr:GNAT family N-acetyltransferase [Alphaproteobacteria bacterium]